MKKSKKVEAYFKAVKSGKPKGEAALIAGYQDTNHMAAIEKTEQFLALEKKYKDVFLEKLSLSQIADEHIKNILQDKDRGAKNKAVEMALDRIEPESAPKEEPEKVVVVLKG